jgi:peptidoglycan/xylan/chitin deacetylase (PgdA/CDA1 family)
MTRFHMTVFAAVLLNGLAWILGSVSLLCLTLAAFAVVIGLGVAIPRLSFFGPFICQGDGARRCVALTFDDGPDARSTPALLDALREADVPATFFCIGKKVAADGELAARILREGHLLGNHTFNHCPTTNFFTTGRLREELAQTQTAIQNAAAVVPQWFRPPMGLSNPRTFRVARALGLKVIGWSARGLDTVTGDPPKIVARIVRRLKPGAIILLHDGNIPAERLVLTVRLLLATLQARGYEVVRLDKILK